MNREFIPYEEARLLKGLGFNEPCLRYYWEGATELMGNNTSPKTNWELTDLSNSDLKELQGTVFMSAPLYQQAFRWFREEFNNFSNFERTNQGNFNYVINRKSDNICYKSYEEAELECLRKLIKIINQNKDE
jgi:hypothetical protein